MPVGSKHDRVNDCFYMDIIRLNKSTIDRRILNHIKLNYLAEARKNQLSRKKHKFIHESKFQIKQGFH